MAYILSTGAFKNAVKASTWDVDEFIKSCYWLFKDTPARRQDYYKKVGVGFQADCILNELMAKKVTSELKDMEFRSECKDLLCDFVERLLSKSPLQYTLTRNVDCLDPREMAKGRESRKPKMKRCLQILVENTRIQTRDCDQVMSLEAILMKLSLR